MDTLNKYRKIIEKVLLDYAAVPYAHGKFETEIIFDQQRDRYLLMNVGWDNGHRVHGCIIHIDIISEKIWIQRDGTENGIALDLEEAGIPKNRIVLGFREPELRPYTGYATV
ncbi:XisI protein [Gloeocapsa sp. PCC 73106]|uniref:XisI protein n=1 Tax=Gloeocapsa sp. PCC 73106 TaxID=102232 RepID=UPI0002ABAE9B|nr:XisI protein [Gloeocapsa sp. PCC 73106]ELS00128.1 XisI protein [Gloeocapsa sp. PCC 73106]